MRGWRRFPGQRRPRRRSAAMRAVATKSLVIWPRACWSEGCFFDHWRSDMAFSLVTGGATRRAVRKHRAPKGALRLNERRPPHRAEQVRKHRAPKDALLHVHENIDPGFFTLVQRNRQKAPSTKRCIKSSRPRTSRSCESCVRKHRAPKGALRPNPTSSSIVHLSVRKHRAAKISHVIPFFQLCTNS